LYFIYAMYKIGSVEVEEEIAQECFACDLNQCKGGCCTLPGGRGAPLMDEEILEIEKWHSRILQFLPEEHREVIKQIGTFEGSPGNYATVCVGQKACVFVYYEGDIARCAFEKAYLEGIIAWRKPISCHLFPIRVRRGNVDYLYYERISECAAGRKLGISSNIYLVNFLKDALIRKYGKEWYNNFLSVCKDVTKSKS